MKRGDVHEYTLGNARVRIVIISANPYNPRRATFAVIRGADVRAPDLPAIVATRDTDPVRGSIDLTQLRPVITENIGTRIGRMSHTTIQHIDNGLRNYLSL